MKPERKARDSFAVSAANALLRFVASRSYRDSLTGCIRAGLEALRFRARETDCGVCGAPAFCMVEVCEGYAVPRCIDHRELPAYQAEARLHSILAAFSPSRSKSSSKGRRPQCLKGEQG